MVGILVSADLGVEVAFWSIFVCLTYDKVHLRHWIHVSGHEEVNVFPLQKRSFIQLNRRFELFRAWFADIFELQYFSLWCRKQ